MIRQVNSIMKKKEKKRGKVQWTALIFCSQCAIMSTLNVSITHLVGHSPVGRIYNLIMSGKFRFVLIVTTPPPPRTHTKTLVISFKKKAKRGLVDRDPIQ